tara:strand:- start:986 stop:1648 length:663 start_codon:yes stop_codon:yes gene_type:complete
MSKEFIKRLLSSLALVPLVLFFVINGAYYFIFFILVVSIISIYEWYLMSKNKAYKIPGIIFLIFSFYTAYYLRNEMYGDYLYFIVIIFICISTDIGGYTFGKIFKGPKLTKISPKKTYAGVIGGYFCSIIFMALFLNYADYISAITNTDTLAQKLFINNFILTILISTVSQIGDIIISYFKRKSKIKNTGKIIPGHGGLLDRIDGMIFVFPLTFLIFKIL